MGQSATRETLSSQFAAAKDRISRACC